MRDHTHGVEVVYERTQEEAYREEARWHTGQRHSDSRSSHCSGGVRGRPVSSRGLSGFRNGRSKRTSRTSVTRWRRTVSGWWSSQRSVATVGSRLRSGRGRPSPVVVPSASRSISLRRSLRFTGGGRGRPRSQRRSTGGAGHGPACQPAVAPAMVWQGALAVAPCPAWSDTSLGGSAGGIPCPHSRPLSRWTGHGGFLAL